MRPVIVAVGPLAAASATNITTDTPRANTPLAMVGTLSSNGVATLDKPRRILVTYGNEVSSRTLTLTGTNWSGSTITESISIPSGGAGTVSSVLDYLTLTQAISTTAFSLPISLGTNSVAASPWVRFDEWAFAQVGIQCTVSGTVNYTVQQTMDDPNSLSNPVTPANMTWINSYDTNVVNATTTQFSSFAYAPMWARVLLNSGTGSVTATFVQYADAPMVR